MPDLRLVELIDSVAEGAEVNWEEAAGSARSDQERHLLEDLRTVADIAQLHRVFAAAPEPAASPPLDMTGWGELEIVDRLGGGAFGDVYLARDPRLHRLVALKLLAQSLTTQVTLAARLLEEARILARVRHPNVVGVFGAGVHQGRAGFWMEHVDGDTLEDRLTADGPLSADEAAAVGRQVCRALAAVHNAGLIHRDVKARNIMRERGGRIVLMDFGAGVPIEEPPGAGEACVGTPMYLAPETLAGAPASQQDDVYAVGVLLYQLVSGRFPYAAASLDALRRAQASGGATPLQTLRPDLPSPLIQVIERAIAPADTRYQSAGDMAAALERVIVAPPVPRVRHVARWLGGLSLLAAAAMLAVLWVKPAPPPGPAIHAGALTVVRFANGTGEPSLDLLAAALSRDVHRHLRRLHVPVRGAAPVASPPALEATLVTGAAAPAEGIVTAAVERAATDRIALGVRVAAAGDVQWRGEYVATHAELPGLGRRVAADIARAMGRPPSSDEWKPASSYPAYDAYQRGRTHADERTDAGLQRSIEYYQQAIRLAPDYAEPWAGLADSYILRGIPAFGTLAPRESRRLASDAAINALQRDPYSAEAHTSLAYIAYFHDWDWPNAEARFRRAIELEPQYVPAHHWYADYLNAMGRQGEALAEIQAAAQIDPRSLVLQRDIGWHLFFQRRYGEAIDQLRRTHARDPGFVMAQSLLGRVLAAAGQHAEALQELRAVAPRLPSAATALAFIAQAEAASGAQAQARRHLSEALRAPDADRLPPYYVALVYAALDEPEQAMTWLRRGFETFDATMVNVDQDPRFDPLRARADFEGLLRTMRFPDAVARAQATSLPSAVSR